MGASGSQGVMEEGREWKVAGGRDLGILGCTSCSWVVGIHSVQFTELVSAFFLV